MVGVAVSYTHLDVYKRQAEVNKPSTPPALPATAKATLDPIAQLAKQVMATPPIATEPANKPDATELPPQPVASLPKATMQKGMRPLICLLYTSRCV